MQNAIDVVVGMTAAGELVVADGSFNSTYSTPEMTAGAGVSILRPTRDCWIASEVGKGSIQQAVRLTDAEAAPFRARAENISGMFNERYGWALAGFVSKSMDLRRLVPASGSNTAAVQYGDLCQVNSSFGAVLERNSFRQTIGRGGVLNSIGAVVRENVFEGAT